MTAPTWHTATTPEALALHDATWAVDPNEEEK